MTLVVDLCYEPESISRYEFVYPIANALKSAGADVKAVHFTELKEEDLRECDKIVLCGTALKDNTYMDRMNLFSWIKSCRKPVLGICAGMQVIGAALGGKVVPQPGIGLQEIDVVKETPLLGEPRLIEGYQLHNFGVTLPEGFELVAGTSEVVDAFKHPDKDIYGIIFHPEVRNRWILERFSGLKPVNGP